VLPLLHNTSWPCVSVSFNGSRIGKVLTRAVVNDFFPYLIHAYFFLPLKYGYIYPLCFFISLLELFIIRLSFLNIRRKKNTCFSPIVHV